VGHVGWLSLGFLAIGGDALAKRFIWLAAKADKIMSIELDLRALVSDEDRTLLVAGLQALHRERVAAYNAAVSVAIIRGDQQPGRELFGLSEASDMLRRVGAAPSSF
jgi:hypothetical protein